jgi:hypothetical protein
MDDCFLATHITGFVLICLRVNFIFIGHLLCVICMNNTMVLYDPFSTQHCTLVSLSNCLGSAIHFSYAIEFSYDTYYGLFCAVYMTINRVLYDPFIRYRFFLCRMECDHFIS